MPCPLPQKVDGGKELGSNIVKQVWDIQPEVLDGYVRDCQGASSCKIYRRHALSLTGVGEAVKSGVVVMASLAEKSIACIWDNLVYGR